MPGIDPALAPWLQLGVAGAVVVALITGLMVTKGHADEIREQRKEAMDGWKSQTEATKELTGVVREQAGTIKDLGATIAELRIQVAEIVRREAPRARG